MANTAPRSGLAYRVVRAFPASSRHFHAPTVGQVLYCMRVGSDLEATFAFCGPCGESLREAFTQTEWVENIEICPVSELPDRIKTILNIKDDGVRVVFTKGALYQMAEPMGLCRAGTVLRCIKGGRAPQLMAWIDDSPFVFSPSGYSCQHMTQLRLKEQPDWSPWTKAFCVVLTKAEIDPASSRLALQGSLQIGPWVLRMERPASEPAMIISEATAGAVDGIVRLLCDAFAEVGIHHKGDASVLVEVLATYLHLYQGLTSIEQVYPFVLTCIERQQASLNTGVMPVGVDSPRKRILKRTSATCRAANIYARRTAKRITTAQI